MPDTSEGLEVNSRKQQITDYLNDNDLTDIKIIGFSEGAAATAMFLNDLAGGVTTVRNQSEIKAAALLEMPTGLAALPIEGYDTKMLNNLPAKLSRLDIGVVDIWNDQSMVHSSLPKGWDNTNSMSYSSGSIGNAFAAGLAGFLNPPLTWDNWKNGNGGADYENHGNILQSQQTMNALRLTFGVFDPYNEYGDGFW